MPEIAWKQDIFFKLLQVHTPPPPLPLQKKLPPLKDDTYIRSPIRIIVLYHLKFCRL